MTSLLQDLKRQQGSTWHQRNDYAQSATGQCFNTRYGSHWELSNTVTLGQPEDWLGSGDCMDMLCPSCEEEMSEKQSVWYCPQCGYLEEK